MPVKLQGKEYNLVSERLVKLREKWPDAVITTNVEMGANNGIVRCVIEVDNRLATGHALFPVGPDKSLEKAETTACGRAMAFLDPELMGTEIASADEIQDWSSGQAKKEIEGRYRNYGLALQRHWDSCTAIREYLDNGELPAAWEAWTEIPEEDRQSLRVAATKGGWLSVEQSKRLGEASSQDFDSETGVYRSIAEKNGE